MKKRMILMFICGMFFLFAGCTSGESPALEELSSIDIMENGLPEIEPAVEDNWPERIGRKTENMTAQELSFDIEVSKPMLLSVACVTESGKLDMEIKRDDGETVFCEEDIQTETFEVRIDSVGTYKVIIQADGHTGSFWIKPKE